MVGMTAINAREEKIISLFINYLALEGAQMHFDAPIPDENLFEDIRIEIQAKPPQIWDKSINDYKDDPNTRAYTNNFKYSWYCLKLIRNNLFHANKAMKPDTPERLDFLLNWSDKFIKKIYRTDCELAKRAKEIKSILQIQSF
jgi:hypothetical protein